MRATNLFLVVLALVTLALASVPLAQGDFWQCLATGSHLLQEISLPVRSHFAWGVPQEAWKCISPLFGLLVAVAEKAAAFDGIRLALGLLPACAALSLFSVLLRRTARRPGLALALCLLSFSPLALKGETNPTVWLAYLFGCQIYLWIEKELFEEKTSILWYVFLTWLWALSHPSAWVAVILPVLSWILDGLRAERHRLLFAGCGAAVALLLVPHPETMLRPISQAFLAFKAGNWSHLRASPGWFGAEILTQGVLALFAGLALLRRPEHRWSSFLAILGLLGYVHNKNLAGLALFSLAPLATEAMRHVSGQKVGSTDFERANDEFERIVLLFVPLAFFVFVGLRLELFRIPGEPLHEEQFPKEALVQISQMGKQHIFHPPQWSGWIRWITQERIKIFAGKPGEARTLLRAASNWNEILTQYRFDALLIPKDAPLAKALQDHSEWEAVPSLSKEALLLVPREETEAPEEDSGDPEEPESPEEPDGSEAADGSEAP